MKKIFFLFAVLITCLSLSANEPNLFCGQGGPNSVCDGYCVPLYDANGHVTYECDPPGGNHPDCVQK